MMSDGWVVVCFLLCFYNSDQESSLWGGDIYVEASIKWGNESFWYWEKSIQATELQMQRSWHVLAKARYLGIGNQVGRAEGGQQDWEILLGEANLVEKHSKWPQAPGNQRGALDTLGWQKRERMGTLAKGARMGRKGTLNLCPQLSLELRWGGNAGAQGAGQCSSFIGPTQLDVQVFVWETSIKGQPDPITLYPQWSSPTHQETVLSFFFLDTTAHILWAFLEAPPSSLRILGVCRHCGVLLETISWPGTQEGHRLSLFSLISKFPLVHLSRSFY